MKKRLFAMMIAAALALSLAACGTARPEAKDETAREPQTAESVPPSSEEDGQNPAMNIIGVYHAEDSLEALVEAEGAENARITVTWAGSPWFQNKTVMSGLFDPETLTVAFSNATLTGYTYNSDGSVAEETRSYDDGKGRAVFRIEEGSFVLTEEFPSGDYETEYVWGPAPGMKTVSDPQHYAPVTAMDKFKIETEVGFAVRTAYLDENWYALAGMMRYPVMVDGTAFPDADAFLEYMKDKTVHESDRQAMLGEDLLDMFVNGKGICMGEGEVWLNDPNYMTDKEPVLEVIAVNGIVSR